MGIGALGRFKSDFTFVELLEKYMLISRGNYVSTLKVCYKQPRLPTFYKFLNVGICSDHF